MKKFDLIFGYAISHLATQIKFVAKSGATEVDLEIDNIKISIKSPPKKRRGEDDDMTTVIQKVPTQIVAAPPVTAPPVTAPPVITPATESTVPASGNSSENLSSDESNYITIKASMIGTFYRSSSPENPPFVNVGFKENKHISMLAIWIL